MPPSKNDNWVRRFIVSDPRKHRKGFTIYKVISIVFPKSSPEAVTRVVVWKRYNDFKKLHHELQFKHKKLYLQDKFPPFVKARFFGRFEDDVIEERRKCATALLEFIGDHPPLFTSHTFVKFFESGYAVEDEENEPSSEIQTEKPIAVENGNVSDTNTKVTECLLPSSSELKSANDNVPRLEGEGPLLKLGGTWQSPQMPDSISLSSHSSDEHTTFTDTDSALSGVSTPLQNSDLQFFDPLQQSPIKQKSPNNDEESMKVSISQASNSWLLSMPPTSVSEVASSIKAPEVGQKSQAVESRGLSEGTMPHICSNKASSVKGITKHGNVELPAEMFLSVRTEDFAGTSCVNTGQKFDGAFLTLPVTPLLTASSDITGGGEGVNYIFEAAYHVGQAQQHEANGGFEAAFAFYKAGIACLLSGVQDDTDTKRKQVVREKTAKYLLQAEKLYNQHLASNTAYSFKWNASVSQLSRPLSELKTYKVLGIINKVMLVLNVLEDQCYIMKVLHKSPCPVNSNKTSIMPQNVPYMVVMHRYFETDSAVFLVLCHASGGRLWDHVSSYFQSLPPTPVHIITKENAYLGKKLIQEEQKKSKQSTTSSILKPPADDCVEKSATDSVSSLDHSYLELILDYTSSTMVTKLESNKNPVLLVSNEEQVNTSSEQNLNIPSGRAIDSRKTQSFLDSVDTTCYRETKCEILSTPERMEGGSSLLPDNVDVCNHTQNNFTTNNPAPDLLPQSNNYSFSWKNLESLDTTDLVENAQKLIQSVSETLLRSETSRNIEESSYLMNDSNKYLSTKFSSTSNVSKLNNEVFMNLNTNNDNKEQEKCSHVPSCDKGNCNDESRNLASESNKSSNSKTVIRCKSEDMPPVSSRNKTRERRRSTTRRSSVASRPSLERRFSSDDLFEGRTRATSGSLDRGHQWSRLHSMFDRPKPRLPESTIRQWSAELLVCLDTLHRWGIICRDLRPDNVLLGEKGHLVLTYMCNWVGVDSVVDTEAITWLYAAPEVNSIFQLTPAADWWSFGALMFELLTGKTLLSCHSGGIHAHTILNIPDYVSEEAHSLLTELLRHNPQERLGSGVNGTDDLKAHPFFKSIDWQSVLDTGT